MFIARHMHAPRFHARNYQNAVFKGVRVHAQGMRQFALDSLSYFVFFGARMLGALKLSGVI